MVFAGKEPKSHIVMNLNHADDVRYESHRGHLGDPFLNFLKSLYSKL